MVLVTGAGRGLGAVVAQALGAAVISRSQGLDFKDWEKVEAVIHTGGGGMGLRHPVLQAGELYKLFRLNIGEAVEINSRVLPYMKERKAGFIVHTCSIASGEAIGSVGYNTVKAALAGYVRSLGREMAPHGIVVTGIAPGAFQSPGNAMDRLQQANPAAYNAYLSQRLPRGVMGRPEEIVPLIKFLISPQASMMAGSVIPIDAGEGHYY